MVAQTGIEPAYTGLKDQLPAISILRHGYLTNRFGGQYWDRTSDPLRVEQVFYR